MLSSPLEQSILGRAREKGILTVEVHDLRDWAVGRHRQIDDYPFGGGAGMVLKPEPIFECYEAVRSMEPSRPIDEFIYMTPDGAVLDQGMVHRVSMLGRIVVLAGHYKGVDQRVRDELVTREISIGDYVLSGGELPALVLVDAVARVLPGVLGDASSALTDSFQDGLLDAPSFTRPAEYRGLDVPEVLRSGDHARIDAWRDEQRIAKTKSRRPDLLDDDRAAASRSAGDGDEPTD
ncbi:MAG: tRNA (guanosine(37)-N1)-methyltransferase TrmD [Rhodothermales bacterium]|nr:tRNA (guanosine(37)-N1)-methyltransferase TrmD [Rhodothermales bacterium]